MDGGKADPDPSLDPDPTQNLRKFKLFFLIFFNEKYNTQNYDYFYLLAYYSYILTKKEIYF